MRRRARRNLTILMAVAIASWLYQFASVGPMAVVPGPAAAATLRFPAGTFRYSAPYFFETSAGILYVAAAPPPALAAAETVWAIEQSGAQQLRAIPAAAVRGAFRPVASGLAMLPGIDTCRVPGEDLGHGSIEKMGSC